MKMVLLHFRNKRASDATQHLGESGARDKRNRELLSISGSRVRAAAGVARGVTPLAIPFFRGVNQDVSRGVFD